MQLAIVRGMCMRRMCDAPTLPQIRRSGPLPPIRDAQFFDPNGGRSQVLMCDSVPLQVNSSSHVGATVLPSGIEKMGIVKPSRNPSWRQATRPVLGGVACMHHWNLRTGKDFTRNALHSPSCSEAGTIWATVYQRCGKSSLVHTRCRQLIQPESLDHLLVAQMQWTACTPTPHLWLHEA